jgi:DNA mismatch endonuclease, patch repair protein
MDTLSTQKRSALMASIKGTDTKPEIAVRKICRELGYLGYRLHRKNLPGRPDIAWIGRKAAIMVNGCFWHWHNCGTGRRTPGSNSGYWKDKLEKNRTRDAKKIKALRAMGWRVIIIWECDLADKAKVESKIRWLHQKDK